MFTAEPELNSHLELKIFVSINLVKDPHCPNCDPTVRVRLQPWRLCLQELREKIQKEVKFLLKCEHSVKVHIQNCPCDSVHCSLWQSNLSEVLWLCCAIYIEELWGLIVFYYIYVHGVDTQYATSPARVLGLNTSSYRTCLPYELMAGLQGKGSGKTKSCLLSHSSSRLYDLNSTEERRVCRSLCSLFWACSLFCWEILFQEANRIWHQKPIFSSSHLAVGSVGSTTANDNTSLLDKLFLIFNISTRLKHLSVFFFFFFLLKKELNPNQEVAISRCRPVSPFSVWQSPTWGYVFPHWLLHVFSSDLFISGAPYNYWQASWQLWNTPHMWNRCYSLLRHQTVQSPEQKRRKEISIIRMTSVAGDGSGLCRTLLMNHQTHRS